jgi:CRP/FNR family transcriptional regulator
MTNRLEDAIAKASSLRRLRPEDRQRLAAVSSLRSYTRGETVFREGDPSSWFIVLASGRVKVAKTTLAGRDVILEVFGPGDPLGTVGAWEGFPYPATATALEDSECIVTGRDEFLGLLERHPTMVRGLFASLTLRIVDLTNRLAEISGSRVEPRIARLFLRLAEEKGAPRDGGVFIPAPLTRQEIADLCGTTIETAIRVMSRWGKDGIVRTEREGFVLLDREALEGLSLS